MSEIENKMRNEEFRHPLVGEAAPDVAITRAEDGAAFSLSALWETGPAILIFLRHFGCTFCREHVAQVRRELPQFAAQHVTLGLITIGNPAETAAFCSDRDLVPPLYCLSDPDKHAYHAYGLARGKPSELLTPHVVARGFQATLHGHFAGMPKGDPFQMPGVFVVGPTGIVRYAHRHKDAADNPPNSELFAVLSQMRT